MDGTAQRRSGDGNSRAPEAEGADLMDARYYLTSLAPDAALIAHAVRSHWGMENEVHWVLDMTFREDAGRVRIGHAPRNLAVVRKQALNLVWHDPTRGKRSLRVQRKRAGWDMTILFTILGRI
ncbi:MAG: ISAs1 family transposase [Thermomicrobiales bacterium]